MEFADTDAKKKAANGEFGANHGYRIEEVAKVPAVFRDFDIVFWEITVVPTRSILDADVGGGDVASVYHHCSDHEPIIQPPRPHHANPHKDSQ